MHLSFIQSNWYRQYPFKQEHGEVDTTGLRMPTDLIVGARLCLESVDYPVFIPKVVTNNGVFSAEIWTNSSVIAWASAKITESNQVVPVYAMAGGQIGSLTIGNPNSCVLEQSFIFTVGTGELEPSVITKLPKPAVPSLTIKNVALTGNVTFASSTIDIASPVKLSLVTPQDVTSRKDKLADNLTCDNPVIGSINYVLPDKTNQIKIVAVAPLSIVDLGNNTFQLTTDPYTKTQICKRYNIPPTNPSSTPIGTLATTTPEYPTWPQFQ